MASRVTRGASETVHSLPVLITEDNLEAIALLTTVQLGDYVRFAFLVSDDVIEPAATTVEKGSFTLGAGFLPRPDLGATQSVDMSAALAIVDHISASSAALRIVRGLSPMRAATPTEGPVPLAAHAVMETPGAIRPTPGRRLSSVARRLTAARTQSARVLREHEHASSALTAAPVMVPSVPVATRSSVATAATVDLNAGESSRAYASVPRFAAAQQPRRVAEAATRAERRHVALRGVLDVVAAEASAAAVRARADDTRQRHDDRRAGKVEQRRRMAVYASMSSVATHVFPVERRMSQRSAERAVSWHSDVLMVHRQGRREQSRGLATARRLASPVPNHVADASASAWHADAAIAKLAPGGEDRCVSPASVIDVLDVPVEHDSESAAIGLGSGDATATSRAAVPSNVASGLEMGTADPHCLRLCDDRAPKGCRRAAFAVTAHLPADADALLARPVAWLNQQEVTPPLPPPTVVAGAPPLVHSLEELMQPDWLRRVRAWERRCRRCLRLAKAGDWHAARQMRPPDLWVSAAESMLPAVAAWTWDLRPLARGDAAVPVQPSGVGGVLPPGDVNLATVQGMLERHACRDEGVLTEVLHGVSDDVQAPHGSFMCAPHTGALKHIAIASGKLQALVDERWASVDSQLPFWPIRCDPYSVVDETARTGRPKYRLTNDHSWPPPGVVAGDGTFVGAWGQHVPSLNESMDRSAWPKAKMVRVRQVAEAAAILAASDAPVAASVIDCRAFYKRFGRQRSEIWRNAAVSEGGYVTDERCCFGSAADAAKCVRFSNVIVQAIRESLSAFDAAHPTRDARVLRWLDERRRAGKAAGASPAELAERWACLHVASMYVDDESTISVNDLVFDAEGTPVMRDGVQQTRAWAHFELAKVVLVSFGHESEASKEQPPRRRIDLLGVEIDLDSSRMTLTARKRESYSRAACEVASHRVCARVAFESLMGKLTFASSCYPLGRQWLHAPWRAMRANFRTSNGEIVISKAVRASLGRWIAELERVDHVGVPLAARSLPPPETAVAALYADAALECTDAGFGAWTVHEGELLYCHGEWTAEERKLLICDLELAASTFGLVALQPIVGGTTVCSFTDNTVAMSAMRSLTPSTPAMQRLTAARVTWLLERGVAESAERITSKANLWSDMLSRGDADGVLAQAAAFGLRPRRVDVPAGWREMLGEAAADDRLADGGYDSAALAALVLPSPCVLPLPLPVRSGSTSSVAASERNLAWRVQPAAAAVPQRGDGRQVGRRGDDGRALLAVVRVAGEGRAAVLETQRYVASRGQGGDGADVDGLHHLACDVQAVGQQYLGAHDKEIRLPGQGVASADVPHAPVRRPRLLRGQRPDEGHLPRGRSARTSRAARREDAGVACGDRPILERRLTQLGKLGGGVDGGVLRPAARRGVRHPRSELFRPGPRPADAAQLDEGRHFVSLRLEGRRVRQANVAEGEGQAGRAQDPAAAWRRRQAARSGEGAQTAD